MKNLENQNNKNDVNCGKLQSNKLYVLRRNDYHLSRSRAVNGSPRNLLAL